MLIQNDKILVIFLCLQAKLQLFKIIKLCCSVQAIEKKFCSSSTWKKLAFSLLQFYDAAKARKKPSLKHTEQYELKRVSNMTAEIDIDALKVFTKLRTNETEYR